MEPPVGGGAPEEAARPARVVRLHVDRGWLAAGAPWVPLLAPFWGSPDQNPDDPDYGRFDVYRRLGRDWFELVEPARADAVLLPCGWESRSPEVVETALSTARGAGVPVLAFFNHDAQEPVDLPGGLVFRTSFARSRRAPQEHALPAWSADLVSRHLDGALPVRTRPSRPTVTFCGFVPAQPQHPRHRAVRALEACRTVQREIVVRESFWAGAWAGARPLARADEVRREYVGNLSAGEYALCVRGAGNFSYRLYEALSCGRIPVLVDTDCVLPHERWIDWRRLCVWVGAGELDRLEERILHYHEGLSPAAFEERQRELRRLWELWLSPHGFFAQLHRYVAPRVGPVGEREKARARAAGSAGTFPEGVMPIDRIASQCQVAAGAPAPKAQLLALLDRMWAEAQGGARVDPAALREALALAPGGPQGSAFLDALCELARAVGDAAAEELIRAEGSRRRASAAAPVPAASQAASGATAGPPRPLSFGERFPSLNRKGPVVLVSKDIAYTFPLSYAYLAGALIDAGEQVRVFFKDRDPEKTLREIMQLDPVLVGFGSLYPELREIGQWIDALDRLGRRFPVVVGGQMVSPHPEFSVQVTGADFGVVGEAEITIVRLVKAIRAGGDPDAIEGLVARTEVGVRNNGPGEFIRDLAVLPEVPYHLFPAERWLPIGKWYAENLPQAQWRAHDRVVNVHGGRGCPFRCNFCYHHSKPRYRPVAVMMEEAQRALRRFDGNMLYFSDDLVLASPKRLTEIVSGIRKLDRRVTFSVSARFDLIDRLSDEHLLSLRLAGCRTMGLGIESGSDRMLATIGKGVTSAQIMRNLVRLHRAGILPTVSIMVGQIGETHEDAAASVELVRQAVRENPNINFAFTYTTPFPGSALYDHVIEKGLVRDHQDFYQRYFSDRSGEFKQVVNISAMSVDEVHHMYGMLCSVYRQEKQNGYRRAEEEKLELYRLEDASASRMACG